ncbi:MAG: hypothetical protein ABI343_06000 [Burkholderiaceae bacterium]
MNPIVTASERLALSRQRLRQALRESAEESPRTSNPVLIAGHIAREAVESAVAPVARRNPLALVLGAAVGGALLVAGKPWRWLFAPAVMATLVPQLVSRAVRHAPGIPWLKLLSSVLGTKKTNPRRTPAAISGTPNTQRRTPDARR